MVLSKYIFKKHGIIMVKKCKKHGKTNVKVKKWPYHDTSANRMVL